jgi:hypothetical protein
MKAIVFSLLLFSGSVFACDRLTYSEDPYSFADLMLYLDQLRHSYGGDWGATSMPVKIYYGMDPE